MAQNIQLFGPREGFLTHGNCLDFLDAGVLSFEPLSLLVDSLIWSRVWSWSLVFTFELLETESHLSSNLTRRSPRSLDIGSGILGVRTLRILSFFTASDLWFLW